MNDQCRTCIHREVCGYKQYYDRAVELYINAKTECARYPYFRCDIVCIKYLQDYKATGEEE